MPIRTFATRNPTPSSSRSCGVYAAPPMEGV
jgi:hypothetical protein